jgi:hypothetical protein
MSSSPLFVCLEIPPEDRALVARACSVTLHPLDDLCQRAVRAYARAVVERHDHDPVRAGDTARQQPPVSPAPVCVQGRGSPPEGGAADGE